MSKKIRRKKKKKLTPIQIIARIFTVLGVTLGIILLFLIGVLFILLKGPSSEAQKLFTLSCNETSALKWLPGIFISDEELNNILNPTINDDGYAELPMASLSISLSQDGISDEPSVALEPIEIVDIKKSTFKGKLMLVHDPSKVFFGSLDSFGGTGKTLLQFLDKYGAIACTNAGGFIDEGGHGKGGDPDGIVIQDGKIVYGSAGGTYSGFAGFDANHQLHVGTITGQKAMELGIVSGTSFNRGPTLIKEGVRQTDFVSGINPRTVIGQTPDGTVLLLAVEGRLPDSLGATYEDLADIMEEYGAVNATNMDGGSSSGLYYKGERLTRSSSVVGDRPLPTAIMVME